MQEESDIAERLSRMLDIIGLAVVGTKYNKNTQNWEEQGMLTGISRRMRGDSRQDITQMIKTICELLPQIKNKQVIDDLKPKIKKAIEGLDKIALTYASSQAYVETINLYARLIKEYI